MSPKTIAIVIGLAGIGVAIWLAQRQALLTIALLHPAAPSTVNNLPLDVLPSEPWNGIGSLQDA